MKNYKSMLIEETIARLRMIADELESGVVHPAEMRIEAVSTLQCKCAVELRCGGHGVLSLMLWQHETPQ